MSSVENFNAVTEFESPDSKDESKHEKAKKESPIITQIRGYQKKTFDAYCKAGVADKVPYDIYAKRNNIGQLNDFLRKVKEDKGPIQKIIQTMKRLPKVEHDDKTGRPEKKDYLVVNSVLSGYDWLGNKMRVFDFFEGYHWEPQFTTNYKRDYDTGDMIPNTEFTGDKKFYDIELTDKNRKQVIQNIINNATGTYVEEIKFYYEIPDSQRGPAHRDGAYSMDQFINSSPEEMMNIAWTRPIPTYPNKDAKGYHG